MTDWKGLEQDLIKYLLIKGHPVGVKLIKQGQALSAQAGRPAMPLTLCQVYQLARYHSKTTYVEKDDLFCARGSSAVGLEPVPEDIIVGRRDEKGKAQDTDAASQLQRNVKRIPLSAGNVGVLMFPLDAAPVDPDLVIMAGSGGQMLRLCQSTVYHLRGERLHFQTSGTQAICADCIATVTVTGKPNMTSPCYGARYFAEFEDDEMLFALPAADLAGVVQGVRDTHKGGYQYPILHEVEMTPFGPASLTISREVPQAAKHGAEITHQKK